MRTAYTYLSLLTTQHTSPINDMLHLQIYACIIQTSRVLGTRSLNSKALTLFFFMLRKYFYLLTSSISKIQWKEYKPPAVY